MNQEKQTEGKPRGKGKRAVAAASLFAVALVGGGAAWQIHRINALPVLVIPTPTMPVPNAYDDYVRASKLAVSYLGRGDATGEPSTSTGGAPTFRGGPLPPVRDRLRLVALNDPAMRALRAGFAHSYLQPPARSLNSFSFTNFADWRSFSRMLAFCSRTCADVGQLDRAAEYGLDGVRYATDLPRGGGFYTRITAFDCAREVRRPLWDIAENCDAQTARKAARRLENIERDHHPLPETAREDKYSSLVFVREYFETEGVHAIAEAIVSSRSGATTGAAPGGAATTPTALTVGVVQAQIMLKGRERILSGSAAYMDRVIAASQRPYGAHAPVPLPPSDPVNKMLGEVEWDDMFLREAEERTMTRLLAVRFALRAYRLERNAYPPSLADLVRTGYLRAVPPDPFAVPIGGANPNALPPLVYRRGAAGGFVLYSVGPDGMDDQGRPIKNLGKAGRDKSRSMNLLIGDDATGDFVVGGANGY